MRLPPSTLGRLALLAALAAGTAPQSWAQTLAHRYSFNEPPGSTAFADSVGGAAGNGTLAGGAALDGTSLVLDGFGSWAELPAGLLSSSTQVSLEFWANLGPNNPVWTRVFAFGDQNDTGGQRTGLDYCHFAGGDWQNLNLSVANANVWANNPGGLNGRENVHVTVVVDPTGSQMFYYNGTAIASNPGVNGNNGVVPPLSGINDALGYLGKSLHDVDATLEGQVHEFRIYQGVLPPAQVALNDAAGPDTYVTDPGALQAVHLSGPTEPLVVNQNAQLNFTADFAGVSDVNLILYGGATFTSGNPEILTVDATRGSVKAVAPGTTTVVATYQGQSDTVPLTVVSLPATLAHRYSFTTDATDSVGGAHATLEGTATVAGGKAVLDGAFGSYVNLPADTINLPAYSAVTLETWVDFGDVPSWCRLFNFGDDGGANELYVTPKGPGNGANHWISQNIPGGRTTEWKGAWANLSTHLTFVVDPPTSTLAVYRDGILEYARTDANAPLSLVSRSLAVLGRSLVGADAYMPGSIDEFRIYRGALSPQEIALSHRNGVGSTARDPGALVSLEVVATNYPAFSGVVPPIVLAHYANLAGFNLLPNNSAVVNGLQLTSSDPSILEVLPNLMLRTHAPGQATLTAQYQGKTHSATVSVQNRAVLAHRYSFTQDPKDSVGTAHGNFQGAATVASGSLVLDGSPDTYLELPPALFDGLDAVTIDTWVTFNAASTWSRLWYFGDDRANELYLAPSVLNGDSHWFSTGFPIGGVTLTLSPRWENETLHVTCVYGNGSMEYYTNGVLHASNGNVTGRLSQVGSAFAWIGRSPYPDPFLNCTVDEFRIYHGRLAPDEILASSVLGADQLLQNTATLSARLEAGQLVLRWPVAAAGFVVQASPSPVNGAWTTLPTSPSLSGNSWEIRIAPADNARFFRLWR